MTATIIPFPQPRLADQLPAAVSSRRKPFADNYVVGNRLQRAADIVKSRPPTREKSGLRRGDWITSPLRDGVGYIYDIDVSIDTGEAVLFHVSFHGERSALRPGQFEKAKRA